MCYLINNSSTLSGKIIKETYLLFLHRVQLFHVILTVDKYFVAKLSISCSSSDSLVLLVSSVLARDPVCPYIGASLLCRTTTSRV